MEVIEGIFEYLLTNYALYLVVVMGVLMTIIYFVLTLIKKPIKLLTGKIKNEQIRHLANKVIILLSFGLSALLWFVLNRVVPKYFAFNGLEIVLTGALPVVLYAVVDGLINGGDNVKAKKVVEVIKDIVDDGKVDKTEFKKTVKALDEIDIIEENKTSENELDDLLK